MQLIFLLLSSSRERIKVENRRSDSAKALRLSYSESSISLHETEG